ncbi:general amidase [Metarhizium brunneum]
MASLLSTEPWLRDPSVVPMPWREEKESVPGKLCFAVLRNDRMVQPHPPIARGIEIVVDAVKHSGHTVIEWEPPSHEEALALHDIILDTDGGDDVWRQLNILYEPVIPQVSQHFGNGPKDSVPTLELLDIVLKHKAYAARYLEYWASTVKHTGTGRAVDAVILPVAPHAAVIPGYTEFVNILDFTSAVLSVTKADKNVDVAHGDFKPLTPNDEVNWRAYNADTYDGAPVCVQLMGRNFEEERILGIAMRVEELLRKLTK